MRIGLVTRYWNTPAGLGVYARELVKELRKTSPRDEIILYLPERPTVKPPKGVRVRSWRVDNHPPDPNKWEHVTVPRAVKEDKVDLLHYLYQAAPAVPVWRPVFTTVPDTIPWDLPAYRMPRHYMWLARRDARRAKHIITISKDAKRRISRTFRRRPDRISVTYLAGPKVESTAGRRGKAWLFVGGTEHRKNVRTVLEAWGKLGAAGPRLNIVGRTRPSLAFDDVAELMAAMPAAARTNVSWLGRVSDRELTDLYRSSAGLVYPSRLEGFGLPVLEAMARRTPVITAKASSLPEVAGKAAVLVKPNDAAAIARAVRKIDSSKRFRDDLIARGAETAAAFTWRRTAEETLAAYAKVVRR